MSNLKRTLLQEVIAISKKPKTGIVAALSMAEVAMLEEAMTSHWPAAKRPRRVVKLLVTLREALGGKQ